MSARNIEVPTPSDEPDHSIDLWHENNRNSAMPAGFNQPNKGTSSVLEQIGPVEVVSDALVQKEEPSQRQANGQQRDQDRDQSRDQDQDEGQGESQDPAHIDRQNNAQSPAGGHRQNEGDGQQDLDRKQAPAQLRDQNQADSTISGKEVQTFLEQLHAKDRTIFQKGLPSVLNYFATQDKTFDNGLTIRPESDKSYTIIPDKNSPVVYRIGADGKTVSVENNSDPEAEQEDSDDPEDSLSNTFGTAGIGKNGELILHLQNKIPGKPVQTIIVTNNGSFIKFTEDEDGIEHTDRPTHGQWTQQTITAKDGSSETTSLYLHNPRPGKPLGAQDGTTVIFNNDSIRAERINDFWHPEKGSKVWTIDSSGNITLNNGGRQFNLSGQNEDFATDDNSNITVAASDYCTGGREIIEDDPEQSLGLSFPEYKDGRLKLDANYDRATNKLISATITYSRLYKK